MTIGSRWVRAALVGLSLVVMDVGAASGAPSSPYTYVHDDAGRLIAAVDPDGDTARYHYDAVGNLVSIDRVSSATTRVLEVTPKRGPVGTKVTVYGTGFSETPASNTVNVNGVQATVSAATKSRLEITVPLSATSGTISVTAPSGTASSAASFTVGAVAPSISSVSASVADNGDTFTITGQRFRTTPSHNNVTINGTFAEVTAATSTQLTVKVPPAGVSSGPVVVETVDGMDVGPDLFVLPEAHLATGDVGFTGRMAVGATETVSTPAAGKHGLVAFAGSKGQRIAIRSNGSGAYTTMKVWGPNGQSVGPALGVNVYGSGFMDTVVLPDTGTFTIQMAPSGGTASVNVTLFEVAADTVDEIEASGPPVTVTTTTAGQNHRLTFDGAAGQRISLETSGLTYGSGHGIYVSIRGPTGANLAQPAYAGSPAGGYLDAITLPDDGEYTILVDPALWVTGAATVKLHNVPGDVQVSMSPGGAAETVTTTAPGQNAVASFAGSAGQRVGVKLTGSSFTEYSLRIRRPDGTTLAGPFIGSGVGYLEAVLPSAGTYTVLVDPLGPFVGSGTLRIYESTDTTGTITVGGSQVTATIASPGQNALISFSASAGQRISLTSSSSLSGDVYSYLQGVINLRDPSGSMITNTSLGPPSPRDFIDAVAVPTTGTYTLEVDPSTDRTGTVSMALYDASDATTAASVGGSQASVGPTAPGQNMAVTFSGTGGQRISMNATGLGWSASLVSMKAPSGAVVMPASWS